MSVDLNFLISLLPIMVTSLLGAIIKDAVDVIQEKKKKARFVRVLVSCTTTIIIIGFGVQTWLPSLDWKLVALASFAFGFLGFRFATLLSDSLAALKFLPGGDKVKEVLEQQEIKEKIERLEQEVKEKKDDKGNT